MITKNSVFKIGLLGKPHGVKGEIQFRFIDDIFDRQQSCLLYTSPSPRDGLLSRMPSSA